MAALYDKLNELHIETGHISRNEVAAWFDVVDAPTRKFLEWFQVHISKENRLSCEESLAYEEIIAEDQFPNDALYNKKLQNVSEEYEGIFDRSSNEFELALLQEEEKLCNKEYEELQMSVHKYQQDIDALKKQKSTKTQELSVVNFHEEKAAAICLEKAKTLEEINENVSKQLSQCFKMVSEENFALDSNSFLSEVDYFNHEKYESHCNFIVSQVLSKGLTQIESLNNRSSMLRSEDVDTTILVNSEYQKRSDEMICRLIKAFLEKVRIATDVEISISSLKLLQDISNFRSNVPLAKTSKEQMLQLRYVELEEAIVKRVNKVANLPTLIYNEKELALLQSQIDFYNDLQKMMQKIQQGQQLLQKLLITETDLFRECEGFIKDIASYNKNVILQCEMRTQSMLTTIAKYKAVQAQPIDERWRPLRMILEIIGAEQDLALGDALNAIQNFHQKCDALEHQVFVGDIDNFVDGIKEIERNNKILREFLTNIGTREVSVIPSSVHNRIVGLKQAIDNQNKDIKYVSYIPLETKKKVDKNKWLKYRRQLWMYFLVKPQELEGIIDKIRNQIEADRAKYFLK